ncbi:hypothetical protein ROA7450_00488 [Roseovarius albus]|uniref:DUF547 domain-containing protein n=1 Tax=Roseovarius albus TaxID=1247867 RepID=A0A1X6YC11_9RHOB|nr:DUF547 domain-containing protein [Roseovarius albus]SLN16891.1 hypothetical protein ROA7450_00488 [Roseovarius albus]
MLRKFMIALTLLTLPTATLAAWKTSAPEVWDIWEGHNPANAKPVDHSTWDKLLKKYVRQDQNGLNRFAYSKVSAADKAALNTYIGQLSQIEITDRARPVQLAYWINLYNALTVKVILDHYPVKSIRDIDTSGLFSNGPWGSELITIEEADLALDDIEHAILRPIWKDPRIHYAVNCASVGCPNLHNQAFTAKNANKLMDKLARDYINSPRGLAVSNGKITVSKIYKWFTYDFGNSEAAVLNHLAKYADSERKAAITQIGRIHNSAYDWSLNE